MFHVRAITQETLRSAFAVMQLAYPDDDFSDFRRAVRAGRLYEPIGALMGVFDKRLYVHAIFRARISQKTSRPFSLNISEFIRSDFISNVIMLEMVEAIEDWACEAGCDQMMIEVSGNEKGDGHSFVDLLTSRGFLNDHC